MIKSSTKTTDRRIYMTVERRMILALLATVPRTQAEIAEITGRDRSSISISLNRMQAAGLVRPAGSRDVGRGHHPLLWVASGESQRKASAAAGVSLAGLVKALRHQREQA